MTKASAAIIIPGKKDSEGPYTLLRVGGLPLLDRQLFGLYYHGVKKAYILDPKEALRKWRFERKPEDMEIEVVETFPALEEEFYLVRGDVVFHKRFFETTKPLPSSKGLTLLTGKPADGHKWWTKSDGFPILEQDHYVGFARVGHGHIPALSRALEVDAENGDLKLFTQLSKTKDCELMAGPGIFFRRIDSRADTYQAGTLLFHSLRKPQDGIVARTFNRPMSLPVSRVLAVLPVTPNQLSVINGFFAIAAGFFLAFGHHLMGLSFYTAGLLGGIFMQACSVYDGCDGEIARVKFQFTHFGDWLDTIIDDITNCIFFAGVAAWAYLSTGQTRFIYMGIAAFVGQWIAN
ncbi:CDP-alcohol phosphatidyltransferase family protein, partial [Myxococcota bacterium]|nr:CDP-alcohol phosphatidyltransferase family protein [Myxococcota bacterium]